MHTTAMVSLVIESLQRSSLGLILLSECFHKCCLHYREFTRATFFAWRGLLFEFSDSQLIPMSFIKACLCPNVDLGESVE